MSTSRPDDVDPMLGTPSAAPLPPTPPIPSAATTDQRSVGDIVSDIAQDLSQLLKQELELAKTELKEEATKAGKGAGLLGGAGVAGHLVLLFLSLTIVFLLDNWMPIEVAALIVTALWAVVAAALALTGKKSLQATNPQLPRTQHTLKEDAAWARAQKN
ncbi:phage holin family protein [Nocardioides sp. URHA0020]|uniref:phage holin family protein n=1 Tax=Nocardioides sp. URHA0020 TaxID=1380392 RepID=UPI000A3E321D|nr:phage holin family protein [Nocardioides sp. URHA0020]